jgi:hypothetical protein
MTKLVFHEGEGEYKGEYNEEEEKHINVSLEIQEDGASLKVGLYYICGINSDGTLYRNNYVDGKATGLQTDNQGRIKEKEYV